MGMRPRTPFRTFADVQFKACATSKIELFVIKNRLQLESVVDCCYLELRLKCDRAPRFDLQRYSSI